MDEKIWGGYQECWHSIMRQPLSIIHQSLQTKFTAASNLVMYWWTVVTSHPPFKNTSSIGTEVKLGQASSYHSKHLPTNQKMPQKKILNSGVTLSTHLAQTGVHQGSTFAAPP